MDDALIMRGLESVGDRRCDPHRIVHRKLLLTVDPRSECFTFHVRHHVEQEAVGFARVVERKDVGMLEVRRRLDLCQETLGTDHGGQLGFEDLERDLAFVLEVVGQVDGGHAAFTQLALDGVSAL